MKKTLSILLVFLLCGIPYQHVFSAPSPQKPVIAPTAPFPFFGIKVGKTAFQVHPEAHRAHLKNKSVLELIDRLAQAYQPALSRPIPYFMVYNPGGLDTSYSGFPIAIQFQFEDLYPEHATPALQRHHAMQIFLHEFGHWLFYEKDYKERIEAIYYDVYSDKNGLTEKERDEFFALFRDYTYERVRDGCGHPQDDASELFASAFMIRILYTDELNSNLRKLSPNAKVRAEKLIHFMDEIAKPLPERHDFILPSEYLLLNDPVPAEK